MKCEYQCYEVGGPWIAENPDCPVHGTEAQREEKQRDRTKERLYQQITMSDTIKTLAFRQIQADPVLYKAWCEALTYEQRTMMLVEQAYELGRERGYNDGYDAAQCSAEMNAGLGERE